ncbi:MAG: glycosyltransferase family 1 protein [Anaerolineae bacterium]|nr:glycosyltransferase family 1 protein [Anaerolineae bacterium]
MTIPMRVTFAVPAFNAGDTTRGIEIARAICEVGQQRGFEAEITFVYPQTSHTFEAQIRHAGFPTRPVDFNLTDEEVATIMHADHTGNQFISSLDHARQILQVCTAEIESSRPDLIVFGFMPMVGIAAQLRRIPTVSYLPFPLYRPWVHRYFLKDIPDELAATFIAHTPRFIRQGFARFMSWAVTHQGFFRQPSLAAAGRELGWSPAQPDLFAMLDANLQLVNDLPANYTGQDIGPHTRIAGPLFSRHVDAPVELDILRQFEPCSVPRVFVSMGSSGEKQYLLAAVEAVARIPCRAVVVVPAGVCSLEEAKQPAGDSSHILFTDKFVPAHSVNAMADFAIIHGGQGTVQTAMSSGTPAVGVGMQWEQCANLDQFVRRGAVIRIARSQWRAASVEQALHQLITSPSYRAAAKQLKAEFDTLNGWQITGGLIWDVLHPSAPNLT